MNRRTDEIGFGGYKLIQDSDGFSYGTDAVLLSWFSNARGKDRILDLGTGTGIVPLIINALYNPKGITGLEVQKSSFALAEENRILNGLQDKISFICGDVKNHREIFAPASFDLVCTNPPYFEQGRGPSSDSEKKLLARYETSAGLEDFIEAASYVLCRGGRFTMVHRPSRLADIIEYSRKYRLEPKRLLMVAPHAGEEPNIMLIECVKGGGKEIRVCPVLAVRNKDGSFTDEMKSIYGK